MVNCKDKYNSRIVNLLEKSGQSKRMFSKEYLLNDSDVEELIIENSCIQNYEFIDWINKNKLKKSIEIEEIIKVINGKKDKDFRDTIKCLIYKIIYNKNKQDISKLFEHDIVNKYYLNSYSNFYLLQKEKNSEYFKKFSFKEGYKSIISLEKEINDPKNDDKQRNPYNKSFFILIIEI